MKKPTFVLLFILLFVCRAFAVVTDDYYLNNRETVEVTVKADRILPNTLRLELSVGETETLTAELLPGDTCDTTLIWGLLQNSGNIEIYPGEKSCRVYGVSEGEDTVTVTTYGGTSAEIGVRVTEEEAPEIQSFEVDSGESPKERGFSWRLMENIIRVMVSFSVLLISAATIFFIKRVRGKG